MNLFSKPSETVSTVHVPAPEPVPGHLEAPAELSSYMSHPVRPQKKSHFMLVAIVGVIVIVLGLAAILLTPKDPSVNTAIALSARLATLTALLETSQRSIDSDTLARINAEARSVLLTDQANLSALVPKADKKKIASLLTKPSDADVTDKLRSSKINGRFDVDYLTVLKERFQGVNSTAVALQNTSKSKTTRDAAATITSHLNLYYKALGEVNL